VYVNDLLVIDRTAIENNFASHTQKDDINILPYLIDGENELRIEVTNLAAEGSNQFSNPAGVLFRLDVVGEADCGITTEAEVLPEPDMFYIDGYKYELTGDVAEPVGGWTISLYNLETEEVISTTTDADGYYYFEVEEGDWEVSEEMLENWTQVGVEIDGELFLPEGEEAYACYIFFKDENERLDFEDFSFVQDDLVLEKEPYSVECSFYNAQDDVIVEPPIIDSGNGGGSSGTRVNRVAPAGQVLGASTMQCGMLIHDFLKIGQQNDSFEVKKLQWFLISQGYLLPVTGVFDTATETAVKAFQLKYQGDILTPWVTARIVPNQNPTGWVYQLTRWKINNIICPGSEPYPTLIP
jgi:peptidoglycan hydrolase-like protein with peptidoglycan-binding domain